MNLQKLIALIWLCMAMSLNAATLQGKVVSVADGDTITVLARGSVLAEGPYAQVSKDPRVLEAYVGTTEEAA